MLWIIQEVQGRSCLTDFHGWALTRDNSNFLVCKRHTMLEAHENVKTREVPQADEKVSWRIQEAQGRIRC